MGAASPNCVSRAKPAPHVFRRAWPSRRAKKGRPKQPVLRSAVRLRDADPSDVLGAVGRFVRPRQAVYAVSRGPQPGSWQRVMNDIKLSVIIPTHNRANELADTLACLKRQSLAAAEYEIIVVDDGSSPPVRLPEDKENPSCSVVRLEGVERSAARNAGAAAAKGRLLVFVDDDISVGADFLEAHLHA